MLCSMSLNVYPFIIPRNNKTNVQQSWSKKRGTQAGHPRDARTLNSTGATTLRRGAVLIAIESARE